MSSQEILTLLLSDLGELYPSENRKAYLMQCITTAQYFIQREGIALTDSAEDLALVSMYAAWLVRKRASAGGMPRMLRWALNNRLLSQKGR